jgi:hypothetical protein
MGRSYDVDLDVDEDGAEDDLLGLNDEQRTEVLRLLERLRDEDIFDFEDLPWPRGPLGSWVLVVCGEWRYICQWDKGIPNLWRLGVGRGKLTVSRLTHKDYTQQVLDEAKKSTGHSAHS